MAQSPLAQLPTYAKESTDVNVIIDTPQGSRNKYKFDPRLGVFKLSRVLPAGSYFPYNFGYLPGTHGEDGDPLDVLVLMDEPAFAGCLVVARLIGVLKAEQSKPGEAPERNDRLLAVAIESHTHGAVNDLADINPALLDEIEHFFTSYNAAAGRQFTPLGRHGPARAHALVEEASRGEEAEA